MRAKSIDDWERESQRMLELTLSSYEVALSGLPTKLPATLETWIGKVAFTSISDVERLEREMSDAFFLRLKGLMETQAKLVPGARKPNWQNAEKLLISLQVQPEALPVDDREALSSFCALRNCIAHNDGRADSTAAKKLPQLKVGTDIWMTRDQLRNWFRLCGRMIDVVAKGHTKDGS